MPASYLHGVETIEIDRGPRPVQTVRSGVIALIGTAPTGPVNNTTLVLSDLDAAQFGQDLLGFTIPAALDGILDQGVTTVIVINVLDPTQHRTNVAGRAYPFDADGIIRLPAMVDGVVIKNLAGDETYHAGVDYTLDPTTGEARRVAGGGIAAGEVVTAAFSHLDPSKVGQADLIGGVDAADRRIGLQALKDTYNEYGFFAKLIVIPGYSSLQSVATAMISMADALGAIAKIDLPAGCTRDQAIAARGPDGAFRLQTSLQRAEYCYPYVQVSGSDPATYRPLSIYSAGAQAAKDYDKGFWWSASNTEIKGIIGTERKLSARIDDSQSDVNLLNAAGIATVFNSFGTGLRLWGNRSAAWPSETGLAQFVCVRRTADMINESIRYFSLQFMDRPLTNAVIDALVESVNGYLRSLIGKGALLGGKCFYDVARNPRSQLAAGQLVISYRYTPPPPLERLTFEAEITDEFLLTLLPADQRV
jgi:phage tail sheath protein FI